MELKARLLNVADGAELWSGSITRKEEELGALGSELARQAAQALHVSLPGAAVSALETNLQRKLQAYQFFTAASRQIEFNSLTKSNFTEAVSLWQQALSADLNCVPAHLGLGWAYLHFSRWHLAPREAVPTARSHFLRVLQLDPTSAQARSRLGFIRLYFDYDWAGAEKDMRRAVEMDRSQDNLSDLHCVLLVRGQWEEAEAVAKEKRRRSPNEETTAFDLAYTYSIQRRYDLALEQTKWILDRKPNSVAGNYMECYARIGCGEFPEALAALARIRAIDDAPDKMALEGYIFGRMGRFEDAQRTLEELDRLSTQRFVSKSCWAVVYTGLDDRPKALEYLEAAYDERHFSIMHLNVHSMWDSLRQEPGFISLIQRVGLEK
jgi:tetratricopeptide (TPR) repeat protein